MPVRLLLILFVALSSTRLSASVDTLDLPGTLSAIAKHDANKEIIKGLEAKKPALEQKLPEALRRSDSAEGVANKIYQDHNNKHEEGTADFSYWNTEYGRAKGEAIVLRGKYDSIKDELETINNGIAVLEQKNRDIESQLAEIENWCTCLVDNDINTAPKETVVNCLNKCWEGQRMEETLIPDLIPEGQTIIGDGSVVAVPPVSPQEAAEKKKMIDSLIRTSPPQVRKPLPVKPPDTQESKDVTLSGRLMNMLKDIKKKFQKGGEQ